MIFGTNLSRFTNKGMVNVNGEPFKSKLEYPYSYDSFHIYFTGKPSSGSAWSDRLYRWDPKKHDELCDRIFGDKGQYWDSRSPKKIQTFLQLYFDIPDLELAEIVEHCNASSGYPVWQFFYNKPESVA